MRSWIQNRRTCTPQQEDEDKEEAPKELSEAEIEKRRKRNAKKRAKKKQKAAAARAASRSNSPQPPAKKDVVPKEVEAEPKAVASVEDSKIEQAVAATPEPTKVAPASSQEEGDESQNVSASPNCVMFQALHDQAMRDKELQKQAKGAGVSPSSKSGSGTSGLAAMAAAWKEEDPIVTATTETVTADSIVKDYV